MKWFWFVLMGWMTGGGACPARDETPFPQGGSKKGLQVQMVDDALGLGVRHAALNVSLGQLLAGTQEAALVYRRGEREIRIREAYVQSLDRQIRPLSEHGVVVYLILLAYPTKDEAKDKMLLHPGALGRSGFAIAGFNTETSEGRETFSALVSFLADRYAGGGHGRVWGYIVGNEVNSPFMWYCLGKMPVERAAAAYVKAVRLAHEAVEEKSAHARVYVSLDHHWQAAMPGIHEEEAYAGRRLLDAFARQARESGDFPWHVAYHPYPDDLGNPRTWNDQMAWKSEDSPHVTFKNLGVLCRYLERQELLWQGKPRRVILSEQGIHCLNAPEGEELQAAGFVYAWEAAARQSGIDALIWHRHVDHAHEGGLRLGLWENVPGSVADPGRKRRIHELFGKADTPAWQKAASFALPVAGLKSWDDLSR